ncbi:unnamed protein product [Wuchereria bancrofti]|uniref:Uncharacterized protein n=1 Tax=Wuchereria bancrofti TaxID=6293 RepID=A0A3P7E8V9_WUCBA|nr:unnamed protein product [Wuchereria bancrofti]
MIILCGSDFGTRRVFAVHAFFAAGIFLMSLLSTSVLSGAAISPDHVGIESIAEPKTQENILWSQTFLHMVAVTVHYNAANVERTSQLVMVQ